MTETAGGFCCRSGRILMKCKDGSGTQESRAEHTHPHTHTSTVQHISCTAMFYVLADFLFFLFYV